MDSPAMTASLADQASAYALVGWPVFPLVPRGKVPLYRNPHPRGSDARLRCRGQCGRMGHGVLDATLDLEVIATWWRRQPEANIAIATGAPGPDVVDVDVKDGAPGLATLERLRRAGLVAGAAGQVRTASGGLHLFYEGSQQGNSTMREFGIDFRGRGGYVAAPPSVTDRGAYRWLQIFATGREVDWEAIRDHLKPRPYRPPANAERFAAKDDPVGHLGDWLISQPVGNRNAALYWAAQRALDAGETDLRGLETAAGIVGLSDTEARRTIESARRQHSVGDR